MNWFILVAVFVIVAAQAQAPDSEVRSPRCTPLSDPFRLDLPIAEAALKPLCGQCAVSEACGRAGGRIAAVSVGCEDVQLVDSTIGCCSNVERDDNACGIGFEPVTSTLPVKSDPNFIAASFLVTNASTVDSPRRYWDLIDKVIKDAIRSDIKPKQFETKLKIGTGTLDCPNDGFTPAGEPWREGGLDRRGTTVSIRSVAGGDKFDGLALQAAINVTVRCRFSISAGFCSIKALCREICKQRSADSTVAVVLSQTLPIDLKFVKNESIGGYTLQPMAKINLTRKDLVFGRCATVLENLSWGPLREYYNVTGGQIVVARVNDVLQKALDEPVSVPGGVYRPTGDIIVGFNISTVAFTRTAMRVDVTANVSSVLNGVRKYFEFATQELHNGPSTDFEALANDPKLARTPSLNALRISLDVATAVLGAMSRVYTSFANQTRISDAEISYNVTISGPRMRVDSPNVIEALLPFGTINGFCQSEPNVGEPLLNVTFNNVRGAVAIEYTYGNVSSGVAPGLVLQYRSLNVSGSRIQLTAPPFPIGGDVLQNAVESALTEQQAYVNEQLRQRPLQLPDSLAPFFPAPRVSAAPVDGGAGYFELLTRCKCVAAALRNATVDMCEARSCADCLASAPVCSWCDGVCALGDKCVNPNAVTVNSTAGCPTVSGGFISPCSFECGASAQTKRELPPLPPVAHDLQRRALGDAVFLLQAFEAANCSLSRPGTYFGQQMLSETDGRCLKSPELYDIAEEARGPFYSIRKNSDGTYRLKLMCSSSDCASCAVFVREADLKTCYPMQSSAESSFVLQLGDGTQCVGGMRPADGGEFVMLRYGENQTDCTSEAPTEVMSLGAPQQIGALAQCISLDRAEPDHSFARGVYDASSPIAKFTSLQMYCAANCEDCFVDTRMKPAADCFVGSTTYANDLNGTESLPWSIALTKGASCDYELPIKKTPAPPAAKPTPPDLLGDSDVFLYGLGISTAVVVGLVCIVCLVRFPVVAGLIDPGQSTRLGGVRHWLSRHSWTLGAVPKGSRWLFACNLLLILVATASILVWAIGDAIRLVDADFLSSSLSIDPQYDQFIQSSAFTQRFETWEQSGTILLALEIGVMCVLLFDQLITRHHLHDMPEKKKKKNLVGARVRKSLWFLVLAGHVGMLLVLPLQSALGVRQDVKFDSTQPATQSLDAAKGTIDELLGYAASLYLFNVVLTFFTNFLQLIPAGTLVGTALFLGDVGESSPAARGIVVGRGQWVTAALVVITAHIIVPVALSPAVLIYLHRRGMSTAFWVGLVWLVQWVGGLLLAALVFFRRVAPAPEKRGHVLVFSHFFFIAYVAVVAVTTVIEISYAISANQQQTVFNLFIILYRVTTFLIVACFTRVWLVAYRPQYARAALKAQRAKENEPHDDGDGDGDGEESRFEKAIAPITAKLGKLGGYVTTPLMFPFLAIVYAIEAGRPATDSLPYRRTWWFFGVVTLFVVLIDGFVGLIGTDAKREAVDSFNSYKNELFGLTWPSDANGGAIFDPAFNLYNTLRWTKFVIVVLVAALITGLLADDFRASRVSPEATQRSVWRAQQASYLIIIALFVASIMPSIPDYPAAANLKQILPRCGVNFNDFVQNVYGSVVGSVLTLFTMKALVPVLLVIVPSLSRTCKMVVHGVHHEDHGGDGGHGDGHGHGHHDDEHDKSCVQRVLTYDAEIGPAPPAAIDHAHMLFQMCMIVSPLLIGMALIFFFIFYGNTFTLVMILINFIGPIIVAQSFTPFAITTAYFASVWGFYFPSLLGVGLEYMYRMGYLDTSKVLAALSSWPFWAYFIFIVAEVCIANVIVADIVYLLIWSLYPEFSVLGADLRLSVLSERHANMQSAIFSDRDRSITIANPAFALAGAAAAAAAAEPTADEAIRELDDEFGGQRYGNVPPPDAPFLSARANTFIAPAPLSSGNTFGIADLPPPSSMRDRGVTAVPFSTPFAAPPTPRDAAAAHDTFKTRAFTTFAGISAPAQTIPLSTTELGTIGRTAAATLSTAPGETMLARPNRSNANAAAANANANRERGQTGWADLDI